MALTNTYFKKKDEHLATYSSGGIKTQIDFCLVRRTQLSLVTNAKVIPGEAVTPQHRLLVIDLKLWRRVATRNGRRCCQVDCTLPSPCLCTRSFRSRSRS
uniref:Uncharacterized protein n=1 Tax=Plectus sambesii TaxID=2011161 RepID=A0A914X5Q8_9BILA